MYIGIIMQISCANTGIKEVGHEYREFQQYQTIDPSIEFKYGVAMKDGKALYIDPDKLDQTDMIVPEYVANLYKKKKMISIPSGKLSWYIRQGKLFVYDTEVEYPRSEIFESEVSYIYMIENNTLYLSKDEKTWEKVEVTIVDDNPPQQKGPFTSKVYLIVHIKCKWFENDYEIFGAVSEK
jgi:hypothetical protein